MESSMPEMFTSPHVGSFAKRAALALAAAIFFSPAAAAQSPPESVGRIEGEDVAVKGQVTLVREAGRNSAQLVSGSEVFVRSGQARIYLEGGGEIDLCGPAHFTILKSGGGITVAFHEGRLRARLGQSPPVNVYSALISAAPLAAGEGPRDAVLGLQSDGTFCAAATRGVVRLENQLTGQSVIVPQNAEVKLAGGDWNALEAASGACRCEVAFAPPEPPVPPRPQITALSATATTNENSAESKEPLKEIPPAREAPEWKVIMPPLTFNAGAPPEPRPEIAILVREARVRTAVVFTGRVEPKTKPVRSASSAGESAAGSSAGGEAGSEISAEGFGAKIKRFFRRLFGRKN